MIDIEFIRRKIYKPDESDHKIAPGDEIPIEVIDILKDGKTVDRVECFSSGNRKMPYIAHVYCTECGNPTVSQLSKAKLLQYLQNNQRVLCDYCKQNEDAIIARERAEWRAQVETKKARQAQEISNFIDKCISPTETKLSGDELLTIYRQISQLRPLGDEKLKNAICNLSYRDFLRTLYWKAVSYYAKRRAGFACQMCGSQQDLATHHRTYARHGQEHTYDCVREDLIILCQNCHAKFHDKLAVL